MKLTNMLSITESWTRGIFNAKLQRPQRGAAATKVCVEIATKNTKSHKKNSSCLFVFFVAIQNARKPRKF